MRSGGIALVAGLERVQPYERAWLHDHGDLSADVLHGAANLGLLAGTAYALHALHGLWLANTPWPTNWPAWTQLLLAGVIVDVGLYGMHRFSHRFARVWRLHAIHHSAERLYWLNGERRHPLSALLMAGPGLGLAVGLGAPPHILSAWLALLSVQLAFQHANLDYRVGRCADGSAWPRCTVGTTSASTKTRRSTSASSSWCGTGCLGHSSINLSGSVRATSG